MSPDRSHLNYSGDPDLSYSPRELIEAGNPGEGDLVSTPEPASTDQLTGIDFCPTCDTVVTWERHIDDLTGWVVHDACTTALTPPEPGNAAHARAMSSHEAAHEHQLLDAHGKPPQVSGHPGTFQLTAELPISCAHCDATSEDLVAALDDSEHDTAVVDGRVHVWPVIPE